MSEDAGGAWLSAVMVVDPAVSWSELAAVLYGCLPIDSVSFEYGDSSLPDAPVNAGGSSQTAAAAAAVHAAVEKAHRELLKLTGDDSPLAGASYKDVEARDGGRSAPTRQTRAKPMRRLCSERAAIPSKPKGRRTSR